MVSIPKIYCPGGAASQTGTAVTERYGNVDIQNCGLIADAIKAAETDAGPFAVPIWNSHEGEVKAANYVWDNLQNTKIKITDLWAKRIEFWFLQKKEAGPVTGKIGSVLVAGTQCSGFLKSQNAKLERYALTTVAFEKYEQGDALDGVLVAPGHSASEELYNVTSKETANPNNFTSFVRFVPAREFSKDSNGEAVWITGVSMNAFGASLSDADQSFFDEMLSRSESLESLPKLVFVLKRDAKVGLLFEGAKLFASDLLDAEEMEDGDITICEEAGLTDNLYSKELKALFEQEFNALVVPDFILHQGIQTCLFACPALGIYTHGYEVEAVEPVVRFYINKVFHLMENGAKRSASENDFFNKYRDAWLERFSDFMEFTKIAPTA